MKCLPVCILLTTLLLGTSYARDGVEASERPKSMLFLGGAVVARSSPYQGVDDTFWPLPSIMYRGPRLTVVGPNVYYRVAGEQPWRISAGLHYDGAGYDADDSAVFAGMQDRKGTMDGGLLATYRWKGWNVTGEISQDLLNQHGGQRGHTELTYSIGSPFAPFMLLAGAGLEYSSSARSDYYYGVKPGEAAPQRPAYEPGDSWSPRLVAGGSIKISETWSANLRGHVAFLDDAIRHSPLVDDRTEWNAVLSMTRRF